MITKVCEKHEYAETIDVLETAFGFKKGDFCKELASVLPIVENANKDDLNNHFIAKIDDKIVGVVGCYEIPFVVKNNDKAETLKSYGIGQVCCLKEYRNKGVMSTLLNEVIKRMEENNADISWLEGERKRYSNFGYDFGGEEVIFKIYNKNIKRNNNAKVIEATVKDIDKLNKAYETLPAYTIRDNAKWKRHIEDRGYTKFYYVENEGGFSYIGVFTKRHFICECVGNKEGLETLIGYYFSQCGEKEISVAYPNIVNNTYNILHSICDNLSVIPLFRLKIVNTESLANKLNSISNNKIGADLSEAEKSKLIYKMLSKDVCFWFPKTDTV